MLKSGHGKFDKNVKDTKDLQKRTCTSVTNNKLILKAEYWYDADSKKKWDTATGDSYGLYIEVDVDSVSVTVMDLEEEKGNFTKKPSD